jgi:hypothetical protein
MNVEHTYAIVIETTVAIQREQVQEIVKANAESWWHNIADLWIVTGHDASTWRDLVGVVFPDGTGKVLVLRLDVASGGTWAFRGSFSETAKDWIRNHL